MDFGFIQNSRETHYFGMFIFFPYFSRIMEIHFSQVLGIAWISASSKIFKKPINLKCLCFSIPFSYNGNPLFLCFGNYMDFCIKRKIPESLNFEMFMFFHIFFPYCANSLSHILGIVCINATHEVWKKLIVLECLCFPIRFPYYENSVVSHVFGILWVSILCEIE